MVTSPEQRSFAKQVGAALAKHRKAQNMTQEQLAAKLGLEGETISRFERGATLPPLHRLIDLAEIFDVSLDEFVSACSVRPADQATSLASSLSLLNEGDRAWVHDLIAEICAKLALRYEVQAR